MGRKRVTHADGQAAVTTLGSLTHVGMKRAGNEDAFLALVGSSSPRGTDALLAVADGMGGHQAGEVASRMAVQGLLTRLSAKAGGDATAPTKGRENARLERIIHELNAEVYAAAARPETRGMGTTLTAALLAGPILLISHVGDSRAYLLRDRKLHQLTRDHSWVAEQVESGKLTPQEAREHPRRNILSRALGTAASVPVDTIAVDVNQGDVLLLCSDGLHGLVTDEEIARTIGSADPQPACELLVERANALGGNDNITVVAARIDRPGTGAGLYDGGDLRGKTTLAFGAGRRKRSAAAKVSLALTSPLWVPVWLVIKLLRALARK